MKVLNLINLLEEFNLEGFKKSLSNVECFVQLGLFAKPLNKIRKFKYPIYSKDYQKLLKLLKAIASEGIHSVLTQYRFKPNDNGTPPDIDNDTNYFINIALVLYFIDGSILSLYFDSNEPNYLISTEVDVDSRGKKNSAENFILVLGRVDYTLKDFFHLINAGSPINIPTSHSEKIK